jgi:putative SOS response-associated peptidase YedK
MILVPVDADPPAGGIEHVDCRSAAQSAQVAMCGRYVSPDEASIERQFNLVRSEWRFPPSLNVAPTQNVPVVRSVDGKPHGLLMRWGLIPFFAGGMPPKYSTVNARVETLQTAASYRGPWQRGRRCLQVAQGFYEWQVQADGKTKVPYYIHTNDQPIFAFAALWDSSRTETGVIIESVTHITLPANSVVGKIHNSQHRICRRSSKRLTAQRGSPGRPRKLGRR